MGNQMGGAPGQMGSAAAMPQKGGPVDYAKPMTAPQGPSGFDPGQYASDVSIGTGMDDRDMGRMPVGLGAGGDINGFVASMMGSGLLSDGANNTRMNPGWAAQLNRTGSLTDAMNYMSSQRPGGGAGTVRVAPPGGMPPAQGGGAQTFGLGPDQQAAGMGPLRDPNAGGGAALPYDRSVDWGNPFEQAMSGGGQGPLLQPPGGGFLPFDHAMDPNNPYPYTPPALPGQNAVDWRNPYQPPGNGQGPLYNGPRPSPPGFFGRLLQPIMDHPWQTLGRAAAGMAAGPGGAIAAGRIFDNYNRRQARRGGP